MKSKVVCPRCGQDFLVHVGLVNLKSDIVLCEECEAMWPTAATVASRTFVEFSSYMRSHNLDPNDPNETIVGEFVSLDELN